MSLNSLDKRIESIENKEQLSDWIIKLRKDLLDHPDKWENVTLERYLEAMAAWVRSSDGYYLHVGQKIEERGTWKLFADILIAASIYE